MNKKQLVSSNHKAEGLLPPSIKEAPPASSLANLFSVIESKLSPTQLKAIQEIGLAIGKVGLSLDDALLRGRVSKEDFEEWCAVCPEIRTYLNLKQVEYKYDLLDVVTKQAKENGDVKIAMWLLEKHYGDEYDSSLKKDIAKMNRGAEDDVVEMAFAFVRRASATKMPVSEEAGKEEQREGVKVYDIENDLA